MQRVWSLILLVMLCAACGGQLRLNQVTATSEPPGKITVLFDVTSPDGPLASLTERNFAIFEDQRLLQGSAEVVVTNPDLRPHTHTVLLVDLGANPSPTEIIAIGEAASAFLQGLPPESKVTLYAFDGSPSPHLVLPMTSPRAGDADAEARRMDALRQFVPRDPSRDLYGAYKEAVAMIDAQMRRSPLAVGALVLVSRGPDLAGRLDRAAVQQAVDHGGERGFARIAIGVGPEAQKAPLWNLSTWEPQYLASVDELKAALGHVAEQIAALGKSFYVVSACSASRAGPHTLRIDVEHRLLAPGGKETSLSGSLEHRFEANGFGPGCDPAVPPEWGGKVTPLEP